VDDEVAAGDRARSVWCREQRRQRCDGEDGEVDVDPGLVEHAPLPLFSDRRFLDEAELRRPELAEPVRLLDQTRRVIRQEDDVDVRPFVGRRLAPRLRADHEGGTDVRLGACPRLHPLEQLLDGDRLSILYETALVS